jgi:hypothetical protein
VTAVTCMIYQRMYVSYNIYIILYHISYHIIYIVAYIYIYIIYIILYYIISYYIILYYIYIYIVRKKTKRAKTCQPHQKHALLRLQLGHLTLPPRSPSPTPTPPLRCVLDTLELWFDFLFDVLELEVWHAQRLI